MEEEELTGMGLMLFDAPMVFKVDEEEAAEEGVDEETGVEEEKAGGCIVAIGNEPDEIEEELPGVGGPRTPMGESITMREFLGLDRIWKCCC